MLLNQLTKQKLKNNERFEGIEKQSNDLINSRKNEIIKNQYKPETNLNQKLANYQSFWLKSQRKKKIKNMLNYPDLTLYQKMQMKKFM